MSIQGALEGVLLQFIGPYVEGLDLTKLRSGIWKGQIDIENIRVKPEVLALFGLEGFRVQGGEIRAIRLRVPWHSLYTGKLSVAVEGVRLHVEQVGVSRTDKELVEAMREAKAQAVEVREAQLRNYYKHRKQAQAAVATGGAEVDRGIAMKIARKFINNLRVSVANVGISFASRELGLACGAELPDLVVQSTDESFRDTTDDEVIQTDAMYKLVRVSGFCLRLSAGGSSSLEDAEYLVTPCCTSVRLAHVPEQQLVQLRMELGTDRRNEITIMRSQVRQALFAAAALEADQKRLRALLVPPETEKAILTVEEASKQEYCRLYGHQLLKALGEREKLRLQLLEDVLGVQMLAAQRCSAHDVLETSRRHSTSGFLGWVKTNIQQRWCACGPAEAPALEAEELLAGLQTGAQFEDLAAPAKVELKVGIGGAVLSLVDDRHHAATPSRQLLSLVLHGTDLAVDFETATDHRGNASARFLVEGLLGAVEATHAGQAVVAYHSTEAAEGGLKRCVRFSLEQKLEADHNLLSLSFELAPVSVFAYTSLIKQLQDFVEVPAAPEQPPEPSVPAGPASDPAEIAMQYLGANTEKAKEVASQVVDEMSKRLPDKLSLNVAISSPTIHVPVQGVGVMIVSLGHVRLGTPEPCPFNGINCGVDITETMLRTVSHCGESFDVVKPVPINLMLDQKETEHAITMNVVISIGEMALSVGPQALQLLVSVADTLAAAETAAPVARASKLVVSQVHWEVEEAEKENMRDLASEMLSAAEVFDAARRRIEEVTNKKLLVDIAADFDKLALTVTDSIVPVVRVHLHLQPPGVTVRHEGFVSGEAISLAVDVKDVKFDVEALNPSSGAWEPVIEEFLFGLALRATPTEQRGGTATEVSCFGHRPLLLNVQPAIVRRLIGLGALFQSSLEPLPAQSPRVEARPAPRRQGTANYRVVNLSHQALHVEVTSCCGSLVVVEVAPTGSSYASLDEMVLKDGVRELKVRLPGGEPSRPLSLEQCGAVAIPGTCAVAEFLTPGPGHRLLLLAAPLRLHNQTDLTLLLRFHDEKGRVLPKIVTPDMACDAALVGHRLPAYMIRSLHAEVTPEPCDDSTLVLSKNSFCAVPSAALLAAGGPRARVSVKVSGLGADFCQPTEVGLGVGEGLLKCPDGTATPRLLIPEHVEDVGERGQPAPHGGAAQAVSKDRADPFRARKVFCGCSQGPGQVAEPRRVDGCRTAPVQIRYEAQSRKCCLPDPSAAVVFTTVSLMPALALLNAMPYGNVNLRWASAGGEGPHSAWQEVAVPELACFYVYHVPGHDFSLCAKLGDDAPWSQDIQIAVKALADASSSYCLEIRQRTDGAAAGAVLESSGKFRLRMSCPFWFVERAGLGGVGALELHSRGARLPQGNGITLLPADCLDRSCELVLRMPEAEEARHSLRMPPNFCKFSWKTPAGPLVCCVQSEDVAPAGLLGANCKVLTLKPRLVLTNASSQDLDVLQPLGPGPEATRGVSFVSRFASASLYHRLGNALAPAPTTPRAESSGGERLHFAPGEVLHLAAGETRDLHFDASGSGKQDADTLATRLCFRPAADASGAWSGPAPCSDDAAGSSAHIRPGVAEDAGMLPGLVPLARGAAELEAWSVEVAPSRGTLAVTFRRGSDFVAVNRARKAKMAIRPITDGGERFEIPVPRDREVPYGWLEPGSSGKCHKVEVMVNDQVHTVADLNRSTRQTIRDQGRSLVLSVSRLGQKTVLALEEQRGTVAAAGSTLCFELKLSQLGVSLMQEEPEARELLFLAVDFIRLHYQQSTDADTEQLNLLISDVQAACQLPDRSEGHKGGARDPMSVLAVDRPAVVLAETCKDESADFLDVMLQREATSSRDIIIKGAEVALNGLDISVDDGWLQPLLDVLDQIAGEAVQELGTPIAQVLSTAGRPIAEGFVPPPLPSVLQAEAVKISAIDLTISCSLPIRALDFLPGYVRGALRLMCFSNRFTLDKGHVTLKAKEVPASRGSVEDFAVGLGTEYSLAVLSNVAGLLGKSSLVNLPAVPVKVGGAAVGLLSDGLGAMTGEAATRLLAFDEDYAARHKQAKEDKQINGAGDGILEAGRSLAHGVEGVFDIVRKPMQGAREGGLKGFVRGVGHGLAGAVVKPIAGVTGAVADLGAGIAAFAGADPSRQKRPRHERPRQPRLLFDALGEVRPFSELEAEVQRQLGRDALRGVREVIPLAHDGPRCAVLLLFRTKVILTEVLLPSVEDRGVAGGPSNKSLGSASSSGSGRGGGASGSGVPSEFFLQRFGKTFRPTMAGRARELDLSAICNVREEDDNLLILEEPSGVAHAVPLHAVPLDDASLSALLEGFRAAVVHPQNATWDVLRRVLQEECARGTGTSGLSPSKEHAGERLLEVIEVQRRALGGWGVPALPIDRRSLAWRWVDGRGRRHPNITRGLSREECAGRVEPPCELDRRFRPTSEWELQLGEGTDAEGWVYSFAWRSSTWYSKPGFVDNFRKRRWTRIYA